MYNADDLVKAIKKTSMDAMNASKPTKVVFGKVIGVSPLKIKVNQKLILNSAQLTLSRNVTNYTLSVTMNHTTEGKDSHYHEIKGTKTMTVHNSLKVNEEVIMMQMSGGQKYIVIDRIGKV